MSIFIGIDESHEISSLFSPRDYFSAGNIIVITVHTASNVQSHQSFHYSHKEVKLVKSLVFILA